MSALSNAQGKDGETPRQPKVPVPVSVILVALQALREREGRAPQASKEESEQKATGGPSPPAPAQATLLPYSPGVFHSTSDAYVDIEVETKQGYVYSGKLIDIDADYNMTLREATVRRERSCDVIRATRRHQRRTLLAQLGSLAPRELLEAEGAGGGDDAERAGAATRPRYVGSVLIRSNNLFMASFPRPSAPLPAIDESVADGSKPKKPAADPRDLRASYVSAAVAVKKAIQRERTRNREARRKRLAAIKKKKESG